ncbi:hypothetical protein EDD18DRAFT_1109057 [Armillaria luteobubalina]|uniref:Uncharacterized protein n=1 Tax=Armillaria luteobubalina TaxID=153913 RepID=A0AA39PYZ1_9AGAR|nr:hypothetical protein EDD18DRAFT_1109057 [Armillaria luteobubalina]
MPVYSPYALISSNYGVTNTCERLYHHLRSASSLYDVLGPDFDCITVQPMGGHRAQIDPFLLTLLTALSNHPSITNISLSGLDWSDFESRDLWHSTIQAFSHTTSVELEEVSLGADEFCSLMRAFPKLTDLIMDEVELSSVFPVRPSAGAFDAKTIRNYQNGPELLSLSVTVGEGTNTLDLFTQIHSPVSLRRLESLAINGTGGEDVIHQIAALLDIAKPYDLMINCVDFDLVRSPLLDLSSVKSLEVVIPLVGEHNFKHTNDCLKWWELIFRRFPEVNNLTDVSIAVDIAPKTLDLLPTGGNAFSWLLLDEVLSNTLKFRLKKFSAVARPLDMSDSTFSLNTRVYDEWLKSEVLVDCFERHQGLSLRRES